ncbi:hypothetical protein K449DRAFT_446941 [Hypoxylon sp. EC38]|nr:hypothetical protein K449DRAFT_446941 [Hypoxylon sp. EC38]
MVLQDERIGVVGRTGLGNLSLATTIFRLAELSWGQITIDRLDTRHIPLPTLRSRISIISQDTTLFQGTIRSNLDPFGEHTVQTWNYGPHLIKSGRRIIRHCRSYISMPRLKRVAPTTRKAMPAVKHCSCSPKEYVYRTLRRSDLLS